ncbi:MAG: hypothetical protein RR705_07850 [Lachnospiraceae bacterium]
MAKKFTGIGEILSGKDFASEVTNEKKESKVVDASEKMITTSYRIKVSLHKKIKFAAIEQGLKEHEVLANALKQYFDSLNK